MSPIKSTFGKSVGKLLNVFRNRDLTLNSSVVTRRIPPFIATGGTKIIEPDGYAYHYFTSPGTFVVSGSDDVDYIIIGGGGAGCGQPSGNNHGGGGAGAGGVRTGSLPVSEATYPVTIGATKPAPPLSYDGAFGNPSSAFGITAQGGGSGGGYNQSPTNDYNGGSGGGAPAYLNTFGIGGVVTGTTTPAPDTGFPGGQIDPTIAASAGGGGAGGAGGDVITSTVGGKGGLGITFPGWTIPPSYGTPGPTPGRWFAGGGGGGSNVTGGAAPDGGGGGAGSTDTNGSPAIDNTGGGGGSAAGDGGLTGGSGGSGIVIVRYTI